MGVQKHRTSGHPTRSPRYKLQQQLEADALAKSETEKRPKPKMYSSVAEALKNR